MSIRLRLSLLYSAILALTLIVFSTALYFVLQQNIYGALENDLKEDLQQIADAAALPDSPYWWNKGKLVAAPLYAQKCDPDGTIFAQTPLLRERDLALPITDRMTKQIRSRGESLDRAVVDDTPMLIYSKPFRYRNGAVGMVQVARDSISQDRSLRALRNGFAVGSGVVTLLAFGVGWVLSGTALRPINRITGTARAIGADRDFGRRVAYDGPRDEVGRLATTFNTMLAELQAAYSKVEHALQTQRRFVADASHELRTPLTTIRGNLGLLQRQPPISPTDRDAVLADIVDETERMSRLVNDLLTLARTDAGRPLRSEPVAIRPLLRELCRNARALSTAQTIHCSDQVDANVQGDEDALKQVLLILLDNALKYTPPHGTVTITASAAAKQIAISVRDTGPGIAPELVPHLFERFRRGDAARSGGGTGLGLAIAKALMEAQHGTIAVDSVVGYGSTFTITLPRAA